MIAQEHCVASTPRIAAAWAVHAFTACGAVVGFLALEEVYSGHYFNMLWLFWLAVAIDGIDGFFARAVRVKEVLPQFDGELLDNIVDYFTYVVVPAAFVRQSDLVQPLWKSLLPGMMLLASAYQFCRRDAKTTDHFFRGFPSVWNIVVCYMLVFSTSQQTNTLALLLGVIFVFVPIKFVYPSRMENVTSSSVLRAALLGTMLFWIAGLLAMQWYFPVAPVWSQTIAIGFPLLYLGVSLYRTFRPLAYTM